MFATEPRVGGNPHSRGHIVSHPSRQFVCLQYLYRSTRLREYHNIILRLMISCAIAAQARAGWTTEYARQNSRDEIIKI